ncbi:ABC transporter ATP-binding protein [Bradyrhizobium sp. CB82]|uniref:ABC transporter ATP-binding protein n=1 Tax=Bradyrhizobium sp. CB82 TaxID=3039159 RepID=UPI0024B17543|nr:ABC transporter ATP-binding protein [Bradyrhizobium sp. CB82]WFU43916.1 ABC transporter ATP-binding protein [Bradyrhizobium sp. CB82]
MTALPALVSLRSVCRTYRTDGVAVTAVRDVSFDIRRGESLAIMGPSGSGKSTLMNMIGLLDRPSEGEILLEGGDVADLPDDRRSELRAHSIGFVFQSYNLLARHNALENVALPLVYGGIRHKQRMLRAEQCLEAVGMLHRARHFPRQLSGGEQQRIAIARALVASPAILLADEPTGALDSRTGAEILALFDALHDGGQTIVMITHDSSVAARCERTIRLHDGEVVADEIRDPMPKKVWAS